MNKEITGANQINPRLAATYAEMAQGIRDIARDKKYARLDMSSIAGAFGNAMQRNWSKWGPYIQNERVKRIGTTPMQYTRWEIEQMLTAPRGSERALRQISRGLFANKKYSMFRIGCRMCERQNRGKGSKHQKSGNNIGSGFQEESTCGYSMRILARDHYIVP